jgi:hypothetical protein
MKFSQCEALIVSNRSERLEISVASMAKQMGEFERIAAGEACLAPATDISGPEFVWLAIRNERGPEDRFAKAVAGASRLRFEGFVHPRHA